MKSNARVSAGPAEEEQEDREAAHGAAAEEWERGTDGRAKEAVRRAMRLLMSRDRSERELLERLGREGFGPEETGTALEYVKSYGYVNDRRYAENYVMSAGGKKSRAAPALISAGQGHTGRTDRRGSDVGCGR